MPLLTLFSFCLNQDYLYSAAVWSLANGIKQISKHPFAYTDKAKVESRRLVSGIKQIRATDKWWL
ncbi:MAG TPA: hypothetical protein VIJ75_11360 [Hanamia sp.]